MPKRNQGLIPLTHDHHHALAQARRLRLAADDPEADIDAPSRDFVGFFRSETITHFREEEEVVFPLAASDERAQPLLGRVLLEHLQLHELVGVLAAEIEEDRVDRETAGRLARALERHIRFEEGEVFPLLEEIVPEQRLTAISLAPRNRTAR